MTPSEYLAFEYFSLNTSIELFWNCLLELLSSSWLRQKKGTRAWIDILVGWFRVRIWRPEWKHPLSGEQSDQGWQLQAWEGTLARAQCSSSYATRAARIRWLQFSLPAPLMWAYKVRVDPTLPYLPTPEVFLSCAGRRNLSLETYEVRTWWADGTLLCSLLSQRRHM